MENYPVQIRKSVELLQQMRSNSENMAIWKNHPLALEVLSLLDGLPCRSGEHTPYDIIFLLGILLENISISDTPRLKSRPDCWMMSLRMT